MQNKTNGKKRELRTYRKKVEKTKKKTLKKRGKLGKIMNVKN